MEAEAVTENKQKNSPCKTENPKHLPNIQAWMSLPSLKHLFT